MDFDFADHGTVSADSFQSTVPENFRSFYKEGDDGNYTIDSANPAVSAAVASISGLNRSLRAARGELKDAKSKAVDLSPLSAYGENVEGILAGIEAKLEETRKTGKTDTDVETAVAAAREAMAQQHAADMDKGNKRIEALTGQLHQHLVVSAAQSALSPVAVDVDLALPHVLKHVDVSEEEGKFNVTIKGVDGQPRYGPTGKLMTVGELVSEMRENDKFAPLFKSDSPSGGGSDPSGPARPKSPATQRREGMSSTDKIAAGLAQRQQARGRR